MLTSQDCITRYGDPEKESNMVLWDIPPALEVGVIPKRLYCNKDLVKPLTQAIVNLIATGHIKELKTFDGCFNIRKKRTNNSYSLHSWGVAIDINAAWNRLGQKPTFSAGFVKCFKDAGFEWGGDWSYPDGIHYQLKK